jgi:nucleotidyltransferase/DNA polymerase involved in DNA repair
LLADSACAIAASYMTKAFGIKTGTLVQDAPKLCPDVIPVQANHRGCAVIGIPTAIRGRVVGVLW